MSVVSEKFDMGILDEMTVKVARCVVNALEDLGYDCPNETPSHVVYEVCDESVLDVTGKKPAMNDLIDMLGLTEDSPMSKKWNLVLYCDVLVEMYERLGTSDLAEKWKMRRRETFNAFGAMTL